MVPSYLCSVILNTYGNYLHVPKQYADAGEVVGCARMLLQITEVHFLPYSLIHGYERFTLQSWKVL